MNEEFDGVFTSTDSDLATADFVLVVDEDDFQHKLIGKLQEKKNYHLIFASNDSEALNMMRKALLDLILMNVWMPDMDGLETMRNLKAES